MKTSTAHQIAVPAAARSLSTLPRIDYEDGFVVAVGAAEERSGEQWARAMLEDAPAETRRALRCGWAALGLQLGSTGDESRVLGWEVRRSTPELVLLGADSPLGLRAELLFERAPGELFFATFLKLGNPLARATWAGVTPRHRQVVRGLLDRVARPRSGRMVSRNSESGGTRWEKYTYTSS
jgi:hypothetical protein